MQKDTAKQIARYVALGALFLIPLTPLLIANSYFFPFITGKAFYFRILVEVLVSAWAVLALLDKEYRPRHSWIGVAMVAFVAWMFVADLFAINVAKAFWSNFERMEGWVLLIHLLGFSAAASMVLRAEKKWFTWRGWFLWSLAVSLAVSGYALLQLGGVLAIHQGSTRIDATFGNSAYLAIYFLFNAFFALWLSLTEKRPWLKWVLLGVAVLEGVLLFYTETRGAVLGLLIGLGVAALLTSFTAGKRARRFAAWGLVTLIVVSGGIYMARDTSFVQHNHVLQRITSISLAAGQTRFTIWGMAFEGVLERPVTGWGQEGFNYVFDKFYKPSLYNQEPWFDRAHNAFIDWLVEGGVPAFLLYLSLFGTLLFYLWRRSELSRAERVLFTGVLVGYAIHNSFVFDNIYSYIYFFAILAFVHSQVARPYEKLETAEELPDAAGKTYALPVAAAVAIGLIWTVNVSGMQVAQKLITAMTPTSSTSIAPNIALFKQLTAQPFYPYVQEVREQLVSFAGNASQNTSLPQAQRQEIAAMAVDNMKKQVAAYPLDTREVLELAYAYEAAGDTKSALTQIKSAEKLSPGKETIWLQDGSLEWTMGNAKAAQAAFNHAYQLGPQFKKLAAYAAAGDIAAGERSKGDALLMSTYGTTTVDSNALAAAYYQIKDWKSLIAVWKLRADQPNASSQTWLALASAYYVSGDKTHAVAVLKQVIAKFPNSQASSEAQALIGQIQPSAGK